MRQVSFFGCSASSAANKFPCPLGKRMFIFVFLRGHKHEILNAVVRSIAVNMMHMLTGLCVCSHTVFVLPLAWFRRFHHNIHKPIRSGVQSGASYWKLYANFIYNCLSRKKTFWCERFVRAIGAARRIVIGIAVSPFFAYDWRTAERARFGIKSFHVGIVYQG
jgi:hypothetical protein